MIIGITGFLASGKGAVSELLKEKGFTIYSCSDIIREECIERSIELTRDNLQKIGNELRERFGANILTKRLANKLKIEGLGRNYVIESIRNPAEIDELRKLSKFILVFIDAKAETRYQRAKERLKEKEHINSLNEFLDSEKKEMESKDPNSQQLLKCKQMAELTIDNNGTLEDLKKEVDDLLVKIQIRLKEKPDWHRYFIDLAKNISIRSNCLSANMGAIITKENVILSTGYVGAPRKTKDCYEKGYCLRRKLNIPSGERYELCVSVHAEQNAIINSARNGVSVKDGTMYIYGTKVYQNSNIAIDAIPCFICKKMIINAGIKTVVCSTKDGSYKVFDVDDWIKEWQEKDMIDDKHQYGK